jgi:hypothetical protein
LYRTLLRDARFNAFQLKVDHERAAVTRRGRCELCGGVLHASPFQRKPRGGPVELGAAHDVRFSFCCAVDGCRKRHTPPSLRFLGRKVYLGAVVVVVSAMRHGASAARVRQLRELFGVSRRTVERWREWWKTAFVKSRCWREAAGVASAAEVARLPASLLERFLGDEEERLILLLRFLGPLTAGSVVHAR